jgi:hypothetical protein
MMLSMVVLYRQHPAMDGREPALLKLLIVKNVTFFKLLLWLLSLLLCYKLLNDQQPSTRIINCSYIS